MDQRRRWRTNSCIFVHLVQVDGAGGALSPEQETNERQMECLSSEGCKSRSKICKTGGDKWRGPYSEYYACVRVTAWWQRSTCFYTGCTSPPRKWHHFTNQNKMLRAAHFAWSGCTQTGEGALMVFRPSGPTARVRGEGATE